MFRTRDSHFKLQIRTADLADGVEARGERANPDGGLPAGLQAKLGAIPGIRMFPVMPSALAGRRQLSGEFRHRVNWRPGAHSRVRKTTPE